MPENHRHRKPKHLSPKHLMPRLAAAAVMALGLMTAAWSLSSMEEARASNDYQALSDVSRYKLLGEGGEAVYIFSPTKKESGTAPVIFFFHGLAATDPFNYGGWIDHLVGRGNIVIYPVSENSKFDSAEKMRSNAIVGARAAIQELEKEPLKPDLSRVGYVGHSVGGGLAVQLAANAKEFNLPVPRAIMAVQAGSGKNAIQTDEVKRLPASILLLAVEGDQDQFKDTREGKMIAANATGIPARNRGYIMLRSSSSLVADHYAPLSPDPRYKMSGKSGKQGRKALLAAFGIRAGERNSLDSRAFWPLLDDLLQAAFDGGTVDQVIQEIGAKPLETLPDTANAAAATPAESSGVQFMQLTVE